MRKMRNVIVVVVIFVGVFLLCMLALNYKGIAYMRPYNRLARIRATEAEVIKQEGKPNIVLKSDDELQKWYGTFDPPSWFPKHLESKVFAYYADPWSDGDGYVVYVFFDSKCKVRSVALAGG